MSEREEPRPSVSVVLLTDDRELVAPPAVDDREVIRRAVSAARRGRVLNDALRASDGATVVVVADLADAPALVDETASRVSRRAVTVHRRAAAEVGGFDERIRARPGELGPVEVDLLLRLCARGDPVEWDDGFSVGRASPQGAVGWGMVVGLALRRSGRQGLRAAVRAMRASGVRLRGRDLGLAMAGGARGVLLRPHPFVDAVLVRTARAVASPRPHQRSQATRHGLAPRPAHRDR